MITIPVVLDLPLFQTFSYTYAVQLTHGQRVLVEFQHRQVIGFVWYDSYLPSPPAKTQLKPIIDVYPEIIPADICALIKFCANYYHYPAGGVIFSAIPKILKAPKAVNLRIAKPATVKPVKSADINVLNHEQSTIFDDICKHLHSFFPAIIYGITGSGKTEVYLHLIDRVIRQGKQVLVLVPEINLTPQMLERFGARFENKSIVVLTSHATARTRYLGYVAASNGNADIIIGTRLAIFTPFVSLGMIIVDEEHDQSFKQNDGLRYHARDLAIWRANQLRIPVILGSATPSLESLYNYKIARYKLYKLNNRAVIDAALPEIQLINLNLYQTRLGLTQAAIDAIQLKLQQHELSMVFINRRGYSPLLSCHECGWVSNCSRCSTTMVYHSAGFSLKCHHCGYTVRVPEYCPECNSKYLQPLGDGTQKIEAQIGELFPTARIYRIDQDTISTKSAWQDLYTKIHNHEVDILVGTQMLAKGHDFHNLTLVVGLNIDSGLYSYDFRASELLFAQLTQVSGRSGRGKKKGQVLLQTRYPSHQVYQYLINYDFSGFINYLLTQRKELQLPPYTHYALFRGSGKKIEQVMEYLQYVVKLMQKIAPKNVIIYPAVPAVIQRLKNKERAQILVQAAERNQLHKLFNELIPLLAYMKPKHAITFSIDVDPYEV